MKILVTGGAGFIGSNLVRLLIGQGHHVLNIDGLTYAGNAASLKDVADNPAHRLLVADITDAEAMPKAFAEFQPDAVMHLAAESHVDRSIDGPGAFIQTNVVGTYNLLQAARAYWSALPADRKAAFRFLHVSTDEVYGSLGAEGKFTETTPYDPHSPYSASKAASDHLARAWADTYGLPVLVTNCSNNYGPFQFPEKLIPVVILKALRGDTIPVYGKGENIRDWLHVEDHARALLTVVEKGRVGQTYNVGGDNELQNIELVRMLCGLLDQLRPRQGGGNYADLIKFVTDRPGHDLRYAIDASKIRTELGWQPRHRRETGFRETVAWYLANEAWWRPILEGTDGLEGSANPPRAVEAGTVSLSRRSRNESDLEQKIAESTKGRRPAMEQPRPEAWDQRLAILGPGGTTEGSRWQGGFAAAATGSVVIKSSPPRRDRWRTHEFPFGGSRRPRSHLRPHLSFVFAGSSAPDRGAPSLRFSPAAAPAGAGLPPATLPQPSGLECRCHGQKWPNARPGPLARASTWRAFGPSRSTPTLITVSPIYSPDELAQLGLKSFGHDVAISRKASVYGWNRISVGNHVRIDDFAILTAGGGIEIGNYVHISAYSGLFGGSGIALQDFSGLSPRSLVFSESDDLSGDSLVHPFFPRTPELKPGYQAGRVTLRRFAQTGAGTTLLPGVTLGEGAATGAHALVASDLDPWWIYVGAPARKLRERSRDVLRLAEPFLR